MKTATTAPRQRAPKRHPVLSWDAVRPGQYVMLCHKGREVGAPQLCGELKDISRASKSESPLFNGANFGSTNTFRLADGVIRTFASWSLVGVE